MAARKANRPSPFFEHLLADRTRDDAGLRFGLLAAVAVHLIIFSLTWPTLATEEPKATSETRKLFRVSQVKFEPPIRRPIERPRILDGPIVSRRPAHYAPESEERQETPLTVEYVPGPIHVEYFIPPPPDPPTKTVVEAGVDVEPPRVLRRVEPTYTETARRFRIEGAVVLSLLIDTEGRVANINVLRGLPFGLTENAVSAARQWLFEPCTLNGDPVSVRMTLTVRFNIAS
jgi:TonB family protein